jgi:hypothetical protein
VFGVDRRGTDPAGSRGGMVFVVLERFMVRHTPPVCRQDVKECRIAFTILGAITCTSRVQGIPEPEILRPGTPGQFS